MCVGEASPLGCDDEGRAQRDLQTAGEAGAVDGRDDRSSHGAQRPPGVDHEPPLARVVVGRHVVEVDAGRGLCKFSINEADDILDLLFLIGICNGSNGLLKLVLSFGQSG